jgi:hypothetical protein
MTRRPSSERLLADIVLLRQTIRETRDRTVHERVRNVERDLSDMLGVSVPKSVAAKALGVSVTALDKWIDRGVLPVVARRGSSRLEVESRRLIELLDQVTTLRLQGAERALLATAVKRLGWRDDSEGRQVLDAEVAALPRPNVSVRELRREFDRTTPEERVVEAAHLSTVMTKLALAGRDA